MEIFVLNLKLLHFVILCGSRKCPYQPQGWSLEIPSGEGVSKDKCFWGEYEAKLEIQGGWEGPNQKSSLREVWIFSGCTHYISNDDFDVLLTVYSTCL